MRRSPGELDVRARGHCGDTRVCAAASMLVCALMETLERSRGEFAELDVTYESGCARVKARGGTGRATALMENCAEMTECGCALLATAFPDSVRLVVAK